VGPAAALAALHLRKACVEPLYRLTERETREALAYCDRSQLSLALGQAAPEFLRDELAERAEKNRTRLAIIESLYLYLHETLTGAGLEYVALKGITQLALSGIRPEDRVQYDVDLYLPRAQAERACELLVAEGYEAMEGMESFPTDHLPALVRRAKWEWRGDYFAADLPLAIELHFQFWNPGLERLEAPACEKFWERRTVRAGLPALAAPDAIGYAGLHLLKHVLHGDTRPFHVYELGRCLHANAADEELWRSWRADHAPGLRKLEAVAFALAESWFGCDLSTAVREEIENLPAAVRTWFGEFAASPAKAEFFPNKDELWLHLSLLGSAADRFAVARRRLLPGNLPRAGVGAEYAGHVARRLRHHALSLLTISSSAARWWWRTAWRRSGR
jgi:hypothetical protein